MVELDRILSERSDERIIRAIKGVSDQEFNKLVEAILGYLELRIVRSRPKGSFYISECIHRPDGKKYVVFFSRRDDSITKADIESLLSYMTRTEAPNGLVLTVAAVAPDAAALGENRSVGFADGVKLSALLRRFDLDRDVIRAADLWKERAKATKIPGADRQLEEAMRLGYESLSMKDYMKALDHFDHAIMIKEDYDVPWRMKGNTLDEMGYHEQALECYKRALELFPESDETWFSLGSCLFTLGRYPEEIACYDRALQYNPVMQKALINKGSTLHRLGRYQEALDTYDRVLKINYRLEKVHNNRGATLHSLGRSSDALVSYNRAIELKHDYIEAWMNKGSLLYEMGDHQEAFDAFTQMAQIRPELPKAWYLRGLAARKTGNLSAAKASFEAALRLDPEYTECRRALEETSGKMSEKFTEVPRIVQDIFSADAAKSAEAAAERTRLYEDAVARVKEEQIEEIAEEVYGDRAELLLLLGRLDEAFEYLGKSLRLEGENAPLLAAAGNVLHGLGRLEAAVKTYEHALAADPKFVPAVFNLHSILLELGDLDGAARVGESLRKSSFGWQARAATAHEALVRGDYKQALEDIDVALAIEDLPALQNYRGLLNLEMGDLKGAAGVFEKTKAAPLDISEAYNNSGVVLMRSGELEKASQELDRAIRVQRNNHAAWNNRGCALYKLDRLREAIACFDESSVMLPTAVSVTNKGFTQLSLDLLADALRTFEQSLKVQETPEAFNNKGIVLERLGKHEEAQVAFRESLRMSPKFQDAAVNERRLGLKTGSPKAAEQVPKAVEPPGEKILGDKGSADSVLAGMTEAVLREKKKGELEAMCESLGLSSKGTRNDLVVRLLRAREHLPKR
jgi:tetratricopeptide (TPR) repeat protein